MPSAQLPSNPGNYLEKTGGTMEGSINMDGYDIAVAGSVETGALITNTIDSLSGEIQVEVPFEMNNNKITGAAKGTTNGDVATVDNIQDHNTSPFAHADIRNLISAIQGAYIYRGVINENTVDVTQISLTNRLTAIMGRAPILGDVLTDLDRTDWYFDGTSWDNMGQTFVVLASAVNDGLMSKEDYTKLYDLYTKAQLDAKFEVLANKATDFAVLNDTKYPTTKAVAERLLNLPIAELNNQTLRDVFEVGNLVVNGDFSNGTTGWSALSYTLSVNSNELVMTVSDISLSASRLISSNINYISGNVYHAYGKIKPKYNNQTYFRIQGQVDGAFQTLTPNVWNTISGRMTANTNANVPLLLYHNNTTNYVISDIVYVDDIKLYNLTTLGISSLTVSQMDYWFSVYQQLLINDANAIFNLFAPKQLESWITPTLTGATSTYIRYRKDTLGTVIVEGNITVGTSGTNFTMPTGYRPLFAYTVGILTFNTDGTVVSSATGTQSLSIRFTGGA